MLCILDTYYVKKTKWHKCYCNTYHRWGEIRHRDLMNPKRQCGSGKKWKLRSKDECSDLEDYLRQFVWKKCPKGYWRTGSGIGKNENLIFKHRLIWEWYNGTIPEDYVVDHIDLDPSNNEISNLRLCKRGENRMNSKFNNNTGYRYISKNRKHGYFRVKIRTNIIGQYKSLNEAIIARNNYCRKHDEFAYNLILEDKTLQKL